MSTNNRRPPQQIQPSAAPQSAAPAAAPQVPREPVNDPLTTTSAAVAAAHQELPPISADTPPADAEAPAADDAGERGPGRAARVAFGHQQQQLQYEERPGFKRRWFNDFPGRIDRARRAWWEHVGSPGSGENVSRIVGVAKEGGGLKSYLMELPLHIYEEDKAAQQALIDEFDQAIEQGVVDQKEPGKDGRYVPMKPNNKPRIEITSSAGRTRTL